MLTDSQNELRVIFGDNIAEYFNKYIDPITGHNRKKATVLYNERHQEQHCKNKHGQLIPLYHGTGLKSWMSLNVVISVYILAVILRQFSV